MTMQTSAASGHSEWSTTDPAIARDRLMSRFGALLSTSPARICDGGIRVSTVASGSLSCNQVNVPGDHVFAVEGRDYLVIALILAGRVEFERAARPDRFRAGDICLGNYPGAACTSFTHDVETCSIVLPLTLLADVAGIAPSNTPVWMDPTPVDPDHLRSLKTTAEYVSQILARPDSSPPVMTSAGRLLAAATLNTFPNNVLAAA